MDMTYIIAGYALCPLPDETLFPEERGEGKGGRGRLEWSVSPGVGYAFLSRWKIGIYLVNKKRCTFANIQSKKTHHELSWVEI